MSCRLLFLCTLALLGGCQHIQSVPLDLDAHHEQWLARDGLAAPIAFHEERPPDGPATFAERFDPADGVDLREAQAIALCYNPELHAQRLETGVLLAQFDHAGLLPDPLLTLETGSKRTENGTSFLRQASRVSRTWVLGGGASFTLPLSGRIGAERDWRGSEYEAGLLASLEHETALLLQLTRQWIAWSAHQERIALHEAQLDTVRGLARSTAQLAALGEIDPAAVQSASLDQARLEARLLALRHGEAELRLQLLALMGLSPQAPLRLIPSLRGISSEEDLPAIAEVAIAQHPRVQRLKAEYEAAESRLRLELRRQYPDISLGPNFLLEKPDLTQLLSIAVPVPVWDINQAGIAEAVAHRDVSRARVFAEYESLVGQHAQIEYALRGARAQRLHLESVAMPLAAQQTNAALKRLELGEIEPALLLSLISQAFLVREELLDAAAGEGMLKAELHTLLAPRAWLNALGQESDPS